VQAASGDLNEDDDAFVDGASMAARRIIDAAMDAAEDVAGMVAICWCAASIWQWDAVVQRRSGDGQTAEDLACLLTATSSCRIYTTA
jgi:hypothetical protein